MGLSALSIADISDKESKSAKFKLLFGVWHSPGGGGGGGGTSL